MKGAKGGKRDRIISFLFSKKNQEQKELEIEASEQKDIENKGIKVLKEEQIISNSNPTNINVEQREMNEHNPTPFIINEEIINTKNENQSTIIKTTTIESKEEIKPELKDREIIDNVEPYIDFIETKESISPTEEIEIIGDEEELIEIHEPQSIIEFAIFEELEKMIKDDYYEIQEIKYELDILTQKEQDEVVLDEVEKLQKQLEELVKRFEEIKKRYEYIYSTVSFDQVNDIQDNYISGIISEYKDSIKNNQQIEEFVTEVKYIEEYINIINILIDVEKNKDTLNDKIDEKLDKYEIRDKEFEELKEQYTDIEKVNDILKDFNKKQDSIIKDLEDKVKDSATIKNKIDRTAKLVPNFNKLFQATLLIMASKKIPPTPMGTILKANLLVNSVALASSFIETKEEIKNTRVITYTNYEKDINKAISDVGDTIKNMDNALLDIKDMKENFKKNFSEFSSLIPEYNEMMKNLEEIEKEITSKYTTIQKFDKEFNQILDDNNTKVKKIENDI